MGKGSQEQWRPVIGYEGHYEVSNFGRVQGLDRSVRRGNSVMKLKSRICSQSPNPGGYMTVGLSKGNRTKRFAVHRLVAESFIGKLPEGLETQHLNGDQKDNRLSNLKYGTKSENNLAKVAHGTHNQSSKTQCPQGHPYSDENTGRSGSRRYCKTCKRIRTQQLRADNKGGNDA